MCRVAFGRRKLVDEGRSRGTVADPCHHLRRRRSRTGGDCPSKVPEVVEVSLPIGHKCRQPLLHASWDVSRTSTKISRDQSGQSELSAHERRSYSFSR